MEQFLSQCARYIYTKHAGNLESVCLVFPNRRAGVFFRSYLQRLVQNPMIGPEITTAGDFISGFSNLYQGDKLQLISMLYDIFERHTGTTESFDDFYFWGEILLADFNDVDNYLANGQDLFRNVADLKELDTLFDYLTSEQKAALESFWGTLAGSGRKDYQEKFLKIWQKLYLIYSDFRKLLFKEGIAYGGMISREVVDNLDDMGQHLQFGHYYIIGLNALNSCEIKLFKYLRKLNKATFLWDFDKFYLDDSTFEAGIFMRSNLQMFPPPDDFQVESDLVSGNKKVKFVAVSSNYGQAQEIPRFLEQTYGGGAHRFDHTAIVLADESLLFPSLGAIPESVDKVNVTMGYPVRNSVVYGFLSVLLNLLKNRRVSDGERTAYHRYVTDVLNHQLISGVETQKVVKFIADVKRYNRIVVPLADVDFSPLHKLIFTLPDNVYDYCRYFLNVLARLYSELKNREQENKILMELISSVYQALEKMEAVIRHVQKSQGRDISDPVFFRLFNQYLGQVSVSFEGEPLSGLQVMGILETRCLDFNNLIILGFNENKWPRTFTSPSFIPYNLRKGFGLPGIDEQDAMYAYYFYRLIQRADNITATWSTLKEAIGTGELSRLGYQVLYDSPLESKMTSLDFSFLGEKPGPVEMKGTPDLAAAFLHENSELRPFSPSALNQYLQCSLRFYYRYIMKLPEPDEVKDEIDSPVFGNIFHEAVERLYQPFINRQVEKTDLEQIRKNKLLIDNEILRAIAKHYYRLPDPAGKTIKPEGKTILIYENTRLFINRLLEVDMNIAPFTIVSLEKSYYSSFPITVNGSSHNFYVGGKIDRVDRVNGITRILDYKTGMVESFAFESVEELFVKNHEKPKKEILQALFYALVLKENMPGEAEFVPAIYSLRKFFDEKHTPEIRMKKGVFSFDDHEHDLRTNLKAVLEEIVAGDTLFCQTPHEKVCSYCPYNTICQRY